MSVVEVAYRDLYDLLLKRKKEIFAPHLQKTLQGDPILDRISVDFDLDEKKGIGAAVVVQSPSMHMLHKAKPNLEYSVAKSMPGEDERHPRDFLSMEETALTKKPDATEKADDAKERMPETVLVFFSYYSLESSKMRFSCFSLSYKYCAKRSTNIFRCRGVRFFMMPS